MNQSTGQRYLRDILNSTDTNEKTLATRIHVCDYLVTLGIYSGVVCNRLLKYPQMVIICHDDNLAKRCYDFVSRYTKGIDSFKCGLLIKHVYCDKNKMKQCQVIISTPHRLLEFIADIFDDESCGHLKYAIFIDVFGFIFKTHEEQRQLKLIVNYYQKKNQKMNYVGITSSENEVGYGNFVNLIETDDIKIKNHHYFSNRYGNIYLLPNAEDLVSQERNIGNDGENEDIIKECVCCQTTNKYHAIICAICACRFFKRLKN